MNLGGSTSPPAVIKISVNWYVRSEADPPWIRSELPNPLLTHPESRAWTCQIPVMDPKNWTGLLMVGDGIMI